MGSDPILRISKLGVRLLRVEPRQFIAGESRKESERHKHIIETRGSFT